MMRVWVTNGEELKAGERVVAYFNVITIYSDKSRENPRNITTNQCRLYRL
jgi:hypothetical protein